MTVAAAHEAAFYRDVVTAGRVWTLRDGGGFPAPTTTGGRVMPFWSSLSRVEKIIASVPAYAGFEPYEIPLDAFQQQWLPGLERDGLKIGLNWSGARALGYDVQPSEVAERLQGADRDG